MQGIHDDAAAKLTVLFDRLPAEFDKHAGTWILWPAGAEDRSPLPTAQHNACVALAQAIAEFEPVTVCAGSRLVNVARELLESDIRVAEITQERADSKIPGPAFLTNRVGDVRVVSWRRNAWQVLCCSVQAPWHFADTLRVETPELDQANGRSDRVPLRGASIRSDGNGTIFVAEESIPALADLSRPTRREFTTKLEDYCGARKVIWLPQGFADGDGVGRLDNLLTPVRRGVVALAWFEDPQDPRYEISREAFAILRGERDAQDRQLEVVLLRNPPGTHAAYVNFQLCNGAVIVPGFGDPRDAEAVASLQNLYPDRQIIDLPASESRLPMNVRGLSFAQQVAGAAT